MKKILSITIILSAVLLSSENVFAQTPTSTPVLKQIRQQSETLQKNILEQVNKIKQERASTTEYIKKQREEFRNKMNEKKEKVAQNFESVINNLKNITARIETRIEKIEAKGIDITSSKTLLEAANEKILQAEKELTTLDELLSKEISTTTRNTYISTIKSQSEKTKNAVKSAKEAVVATIISLKSSDNVSATTTKGSSTVNKK